MAQCINCPSWPGGAAAPKTQLGWWFNHHVVNAPFNLDGQLVLGNVEIQDT